MFCKEKHRSLSSSKQKATRPFVNLFFPFICIGLICPAAPSVKPDISLSLSLVLSTLPNDLTSRLRFRFISIAENLHINENTLDTTEKDMVHLPGCHINNVVNILGVKLCLS